jgi:hypothetical protein
MNIENALALLSNEGSGLKVEESHGYKRAFKGTLTLPRFRSPLAFFSISH